MSELTYRNEIRPADSREANGENPVVSLCEQLINFLRNRETGNDPTASRRVSELIEQIKTAMEAVFISEPDLLEALIKKGASENDLIELLRVEQLFGELNDDEIQGRIGVATGNFKI